MRMILFLVALAVFQAQAQDNLETRVRRLEQRLSSDILAQMYQKLQQLEEEVKQLRGEVERLRAHVERLSSERLFEAKSQNAPVEGPTEISSSPETTVQPRPVTEDPIAEAEAYRRAYALLEAGRYDEAISAFQKFLQRFPLGAYAPNAYYWMGEAYYAQRQFDQAKEAFRAVLARFPENHKAGDAKLKLGFVAYEEGNYEEAKRILAEVAREYPGTRLARLALQRLEEIRQKKQLR